MCRYGSLFKINPSGITYGFPSLRWPVKEKVLICGEDASSGHHDPSSSVTQCNFCTRMGVSWFRQIGQVSPYATLFLKKINTSQVSTMIHSARPTVSPVATIVFCCFVLLDLKSTGRTDVRTDNMCGNSDHYRTCLWVGRVDQKTISRRFFTSCDKQNFWSTRPIQNHASIDYYFHICHSSSHQLVNR